MHNRRQDSLAISRHRQIVFLLIHAIQALALCWTLERWRFLPIILSLNILGFESKSYHKLWATFLEADHWPQPLCIFYTGKERSSPANASKTLSDKVLAWKSIIG